VTRAVVIGGGVGGASAALRLADAGMEVVLVERSEHLGGLVVSLEVGGTPIERFYHHIFPHEHEIIGLIDQMGLAPRLEWIQSTVGMLLDGHIWPFVSPVDLLRFKPLGLVDRIHTGIGGVRSMRSSG
jgi:protoporphyrinogen oxidase